MNRHKNVQSFRPPSRDQRKISERSCLVCENPPRRFVFAQMTIGLEECYERIRKVDGNNESNFLGNESANEEEFSPITDSILAGRYKLIAKVGEGQSSILVKAEDIFHPEKRRVAIKILHASYLNLGPQEASCLLHLKKADTLKVANIAHVLNAFTVGQHFCIVFEFLSPTPLNKYFQMFPFPSKVEKINLIRRIASRVTECLAVLSSLNIIHTDIKPENILFSNGDKNDVKIIDFGNAIYWVHDEMSLYFDSFELQTVFYRAPEVMFGLPFGPQIDMWSLGCVLAELYLGEQLFLATSKDEILEKMQALLGPFPMSPFQSGKYFSNFKKFVGRVSSVPGYSQNVVNILKKLGSTDYSFADFIARLLTFDPSLRLSPVEAARHPFLATECALGFILPPGYLTQESSYSSILLTPATYPHRPKIDEKIEKLHYSELDLLRVGTQARSMDKDNVMKVLPFNYQDESRGKERQVKSDVNTEERESSTAVGIEREEMFCGHDMPIIYGVEPTEIIGSNRLPVKENHRYTDFNESCSVLHTTKDNKRFIPIFVKEDQKYNDYNESCSVINALSSSSSVAGGTKRDRKDNAFGESSSVFNTAKEEHSIPDSVKEGQKDSFSVPNTCKDTSSLECHLNEIQRSRGESCIKVLNMATNAHSSANFANKDRKENPFNESCSVINPFKNPRFSKHESRKARGKNDKRARKFVLRKSSKTRRRRCSETESWSSVSTDISEDNTDYRKPYMPRSKSPAKFNDDDVLLVNVPEPEDITKPISGVLDLTSEAKSSSNCEMSPARRTNTRDERIIEDMPMSSAHIEVGEDNITASPKTTHKGSSSEKVDKETDSYIPPARRTNRIDVRQMEDMQKSSVNRKVNGNNTTVSPKASFKDTSRKTSEKEANSDKLPARRTNRNDERLLEETPRSTANRKADNIVVSPKTAFKGSSSETIDKETNSDIPTRRTTDGRSKIPKSGKVEEKSLTHSAEESDSKSRNDSRASKTKDTTNPKVVASAAGRRISENTKQLRSSKEKDDSQTKATTTILHQASKGATTTSNNCRNEQGSNSPNEINFFIPNSNEVSSSLNTSSAGSSQYKVEETVINPLSTKSANLQEFPDNEKSFLVTTSSKQSSLQTESNRNAKESLPTKPSSLDSFFDALSDDETKVVSSSTKPGELQTKSKSNRKKPMSTKSSHSKSFSGDKNSPTREELTLVTSSNKQHRSPENSNDNCKIITPPKSSNFRSFYGNKIRSSSEVTSSEQDRLLANSNDNTKRTKLAKCQSISEERANSSSNESELVTSSVKQGSNSNSNVLSIQNKREPKTPRSLQRKESVFDTPCSVVSSTGELLPGGLSEVKKTICRAEKEQDISLAEIHNIFQAPLAESAQTSSNETGKNKKSGNTRKTYKSYKYASPRERTSGRNTQCVDDKVGQVFGNESQNLQIFASEKPNTNLPGEKDILGSCPTDILTQGYSLVKQPRKRKLKYSTVNSPGKIDSMSCLECLRDRQTAKIPKLAAAEMDDTSYHRVLFLEGDCEKQSRANTGKYSNIDSITKRKENAKDSEENAQQSVGHARQEKEHAKRRKQNTKPTEENAKQREENAKQSKQHAIQCEENAKDGEGFQNLPPSIASGNSQRVDEKEGDTESCLSKNTSSIKDTKLERGEGLFLARNSSSSCSKNNLEVGNGNRKQCNTKRSGSPSIFDDIFRREEQLTVPDHGQSSDEDYEVLLL